MDTFMTELLKHSENYTCHDFLQPGKPCVSTTRDNGTTDLHCSVPQLL